jgi:hypothetical protein
LEKLHQEVLDFLWTRQQAKDRVSASFYKGGLKVPHLSDNTKGLHLNLLKNTQKEHGCLTDLLQKIALWCANKMAVNSR